MTTQQKNKWEIAWKWVMTSCVPLLIWLIGLNIQIQNTQNIQTKDISDIKQINVDQDTKISATDGFVRNNKDIQVIINTDIHKEIDNLAKLIAVENAKVDNFYSKSHLYIK